MTDSKYTPGPWGTSPENDVFEVGKNNKLKSPICTVYGTRKQRKARARLIAAAPDLLKTLRSISGRVKSIDVKIFSQLSPGTVHDLLNIQRLADDATKKATG